MCPFSLKGFDENSHLHRMNTSTTYISTKRKQQTIAVGKAVQRVEVCNQFVIYAFFLLSFIIHWQQWAFENFEISLSLKCRQAVFVKNLRYTDDMTKMQMEVVVARMASRKSSLRLKEKCDKPPHPKQLMMEILCNLYHIEIFS